MKNKKYRRGILGFLLILLLTVPSNNIYARAGGGGGHSGGHSSHSSHSSHRSGRTNRVSSGVHSSSRSNDDSQEVEKFTLGDKVIGGVFIVALVTVSIKRTREALKDIK